MQIADMPQIGMLNLPSTRNEAEFLRKKSDRAEGIAIAEALMGVKEF
jgi:hypothetical protein